MVRLCKKQNRFTCRYSCPSVIYFSHFLFLRFAGRRHLNLSIYLVYSNLCSLLPHWTVEGEEDETRGAAGIQTPRTASQLQHTARQLYVCVQGPTHLLNSSPPHWLPHPLYLSGLLLMLPVPTAEEESIGDSSTPTEHRPTIFLPTLPLISQLINPQHKTRHAFYPLTRFRFIDITMLNPRIG